MEDSPWMHGKPGLKPGYAAKPRQHPQFQTGQQRTLYITHPVWEQLTAIADRLEWSSSRVLDTLLRSHFQRQSFNVETDAKHLIDTAA
jgi:hypothetical protein